MLNDNDKKQTDSSESPQGLYNNWPKPKPNKNNTPAGCGTYIVFAILGIFGFFMLLLAVTAVFPPFMMAFGDLPNHFKLPYNAIDFQKIAYIDNQFVMYGIDYNSDSRKNNLVIFNSTNGESWTKSTISNNESDVAGSITNTGSTFTYFNHQCMLIGAYPRILAAKDCKNWHYQAPQLDSGESSFLYSATGAVVVNNILYVSSGTTSPTSASPISGVFSTRDGIHWQSENLPIPADTKPQKLRDGFTSIAAGDNKIIAMRIWWHEGKMQTLIYTKDLTTGKWSYEPYPVKVSNLTRGKDRFVAMLASDAVVLQDSHHNNWESIALTKVTYDIKNGFGGSRGLSYGVFDKFIGVNRLLMSVDGFNWIRTYPKGSKNIWALDIACSNTACVGIGNEYQIILTNNGVDWKYINFNHKNPKPHWWRRFF